MVAFAFGVVGDESWQSGRWFELLGLFPAGRNAGQLGLFDDWKSVLAAGCLGDLLRGCHPDQGGSYVLDSRHSQEGIEVVGREEM